MNIDHCLQETVVAIKQFSVTLTGTTPLVMNNNQLANPRNPIKKELSSITSKGGKRMTDADYDRIEHLQFQASLYIADSTGPFIPAMNLRKMMIEGGRNERNGTKFESGIMIPQNAPLLYDGPRTLNEMIKLGDRFIWTAMVCQGSGQKKTTIPRTRAKFDSWSCEFMVRIEDSMVSLAMLESSLKHAGFAVGICDAKRIGYGRFTHVIKPASA